MFKSDFRVVADYFVQMRETGEYTPGNEVVAHIQEVLQLLNVMDKEKRFEEKLNEEIAERKVNTMSEWLDRVIKTSESKGRKEGENDLAKLMLMLFNQGRTEDANRAAADPEYRKKLYQEFQIA